MTDLKPSEILREFEERLSPAASEHWNGYGGLERNELVIMAQREGLDAAITHIEEMAAEPLPEDD